MFHLIFSIVVLCTTLTQGMEVNAPLLPDPHVLEKLKNILKEEKIKQGTFIKKITDNLKECTDGRMIDLNYLTVKSSYWWDKNPRDNPTHNLNKTKVLIIDRKFQSSKYDREYGGEFPHNFLTKYGFPEVNDKMSVVNSWSNVRDKVKFFRNKDISPNTIPTSLKDIVGYGFKTDINLDTLPSIFQMIRTFKTLKYETKVPKCPMASLEISKKEPSDVILDGVNKILNTDTYKRLIQQNHPLSKIIQNHIQTLKGKAEEKHFTSNVIGNGYKNPILYHKILVSMNDIVQLMSVFDIDLATGECTIGGLGNDEPIDTYYLYAQLYEVFNDLLFLLMSVDNTYSQEDFDKFLTNAYLNRFSIFKELNKNKEIILESYPMRSGMDAFVNASMAIGHAPQDISIAPKVEGLENTVYYEISRLLKEYPNRGEMKSVVILSEKPDEKTKTYINDAILQTYVDIQVNKNLENIYNKEIYFDEYIDKITFIFDNNINLSLQKRVIICENIISAFIDKLRPIGNDPSNDNILKSLNLNVADILEILDKGKKQLESIKESQDLHSDALEVFMKNLTTDLSNKYPLDDFDRHLEVAKNLGINNPKETLVYFYDIAFNFQLFNTYQSYFFDDSNYTIKWSPEQMGTNEDRLTQCIRIINDIRDNYKNTKNTFKSKFDSALQQIERLDGHDNQDNSKLLKSIMEELSNSIPRELRLLKPGLDPLSVYKKENLQKKSKEIIFSEIKRSLNNKDIFHLQEIKGEYYIEIPGFIAKTPKFFSKLKDLIPNLIDYTFTVDKYHSITSGMTTDTIDPSGDLTFMDKLHRKIKQIKLIKQSWNPNGDPFIILWDTTMEIDQGPCYGLMERFREEIESGQIVFVLFKSLQKYANLGVGKSKAGVVTLVGKRGPKVEEIQNKLKSYGKDVFSNSQEYAMMTFFYDPLNQDNEKLYYQAVKKHAQEISAQASGKYMLSGGCLFSKEDCDARIPYSDTFGFVIPTAVSLNDSGLCRYSVGLNPKGLQ